MTLNQYRLVIGNKNTSSWSLRPWLAMHQAGIGFAEEMVTLRRVETAAEILKHSAAGLVPVLKHGALTIWDSMAICEYLNEQHPEAQLWPAAPQDRARARCVAAEMHAGFRELRMGLPMDFTARGLKAQITAGCHKDIARIVEIWREAGTGRTVSRPFLFGAFSIADAMFAPVASRFTSYGLTLADYADDGAAEAYRAMMMDLPAMQHWGQAAALEPKLS